MGKRFGIVVMLLSLLITGCGRTNQIDDYIGRMEKYGKHSFSIDNKINMEKDKAFVTTLFGSASNVNQGYSFLDDYEALERKWKQKVIPDILDRQVVPKITDGSLVEKVYQVLKKTKYNQYMIYSDRYMLEKDDFFHPVLYIEWKDYVAEVEKKAKKDGTLPKESSDVVVKYMEDDEEDGRDIPIVELLGYEARQIENCVFYLDEEGKVIEGQYYVSISEDEEVMQALRSEGLGWFAEMLANAEKMFLMNSSNKELFPYIELWMNVRNIEVDFGMVFSMYAGTHSPSYIDREVAWVEAYRAEDAWDVSSSSHNEFCDVLFLYGELWNEGSEAEEYIGEEQFQMEMTEAEAIVYGDTKTKQVEEVLLRIDAKICPEYLSPTLENYFVAIGMEESEAPYYLNDMLLHPSNYEEVRYIEQVGIWYDKTYQMYRIFRKQS